MDLIHKLSTVQKECNDTCYWLEILFMTDYLTEKEYISIHTNAIEVLKINKSLIITTKKRIKK
ncbi:MAG: four helix bundle protein [Bacteroidota bacterium]